ncbi:hypothetical protein HS088_TW19G00402 [Tripterygium wilfordii]|uniref:Seed maturation protein n=1 Tax=Tripterygium wilfordii TaxID=458696 RepID=A0A7J7C9L7_TRIWF|nr:uncharacterized protein LOC119985546 [Tripterygium wilfordii]KAF5730802.1 hypothetical protein HS088_TW19G00402 [Tripterygium wilfordii]
MAKSKEDIRYATAQAKLSEDEALRVRYKHGTPLEGGKIADSRPLDLFSGAHNIDQLHRHQSQLHHDASGETQGNTTTTTTTATDGGSRAA